MQIANLIATDHVEKMSLANEIIYGSVQSVSALIQGGEDVNAVDEYGFTPLIETAIVNKIELTQLLLNHGAQINEPDMVGRTALHWAVDNNNIPLCQLLLKHGADPNAYMTAGQSVLVNPILRKQKELRKLLLAQGANIEFPYDFINAKLLGHCYELAGEIDIYTGDNKFIEMSFEGFYLEFTLNIIQHSLSQYKHHFAAKHLRDYFDDLEIIIDAFKRADELMRYMHYLTKVEQHRTRIETLLDNPIIVIPVAHEGHALTFIKCGNLLARCDRGEQSKTDGSVVIYTMQNAKELTAEFLINFIYQKQSRDFVYHGINQLLGLKPLASMPVPSQMSGNCSWANVEACVPTLLSLLLLQRQGFSTIREQLKSAMHFYRSWLEWDRDRSLHDCIVGFQKADPARKASKAAILAAVLFQRCDYEIDKHVERAEKIMSVLRQADYRYILDSYIKVYCKDPRNPLGRNLLMFLDHFNVSF